MDAEHRAEGQEGMSGTPGENATPSQHEGASDAAPPEHGGGAAGTSHAQGAGGEVISEGASQAGAGGEAVSGAQVDATGTDPAGQGDAAQGPVDAGAADSATESVEGLAASKGAAESEDGTGASKSAGADENDADAAKHREDAGASMRAAAAEDDASEHPEDAGSSKRTGAAEADASEHPEDAGSSKSAGMAAAGADSPNDASEHREDAGSSKRDGTAADDADPRNDGAEHREDAGSSKRAAEDGGGATDAPEPTGTGRYVELSSGDDVPESSGAGSDGGGEAKDVQGESRSGPVSGVDDALLSAGIWDVASRASQEEPGSAGPDGSEDAATPGEEPRVEAVEPRVMGQVTAMVLPLERLEEDTTFRLRDEGDVSELATDLARLGQLFPVDVRPRGDERYQLICGFRRVAALRFLKRDHVQVRVHEELSDEDALLLSLADAIHASPVEHDVLEAKRDSLEAEGRLTAPVRDMLEKALATEETLAPEGVEEEIDADELASDVAQRMGALNQDLSLLADVFAALDESRRAELLMQLRYSAQLVAYLEGL